MSFRHHPWNIHVVCGNSVQCKFNQPQLNKSRILKSGLIILWLLRSHPAGMSVAYGKVSSHSKSSSLMMDVNYLSMVFLVEAKEEGGKLIPAMMTSDPIPQAIIDIVSCECKQTAALGVLMPWRTTALHTPLSLPLIFFLSKTLIM